MGGYLKGFCDEVTARNRKCQIFFFGISKGLIIFCNNESFPVTYLFTPDLMVVARKLQAY